MAVAVLMQVISLLVLILAIVVAYPLLLRWLSITDYLVIGVPFMTYVGGLHVAASDAIIPLAFAAVALSGSKLDAPTRRLRDRVLAFSLASVLVVTLSAVVASGITPTFNTRLALTDSMKLAVVLGYCVVTAVMVARTDVGRIMRSLRIWILIAAALGVGSAATQFLGIPLIPAGTARSLGFFQDPNLYAGYLLLSLAIVFACESFRPSRLTPLLIGAISVGVIATASRAGIATLCLMAAAAFFIISARRVRFSLGLIGVGGSWLGFGLITGNAQLLVLPALQRLVTASGQTENDPRLALWGRAIDLWSGQPLTGIGIGQYVLYSGDVYGVSARTGTGFVTHNTFLSFLTELGIIGFAVVVIGLVAVYRAARSLSHMNRNIRNSILLGLVAIAVQMMTLNLQNIRYVWVYFGIVLGLSISTQRRAKSVAVKPPEASSRVLDTPV